MSMKEDRHRHAQHYQDRFYDQIDQHCGFKEPTKGELKKIEEKKKMVEVPKQCKNCIYIQYRCYLSKRRQEGENFKCPTRTIKQIQLSQFIREKDI